MDKDLLTAILQELQTTNKMLHKFLTNGDDATEDAMHSYLITIDRKVDSMANNLDKIAKRHQQ